MGFTVIAPSRGRRRVDEDIMLSADQSGVRIVFSTALTAELGFQAGQQLLLDTGDEADAGYIVIRPVTAEHVRGWTLSHAGGGRPELRIRVRRWEGVPEKFSARGQKVTRLEGGKAIMFREPWLLDQDESASLSPIASAFVEQHKIAAANGQDGPGFADAQTNEAHLRREGLDSRYRMARKVLRAAGMEMFPAEHGTDWHVDGRRMTREEVIDLADRQEKPLTLEQLTEQAAQFGLPT